MLFRWPAPFLVGPTSTTVSTLMRLPSLTGSSRSSTASSARSRSSWRRPCARPSQGVFSVLRGRACGHQCARCCWNVRGRLFLRLSLLVCSGSRMVVPVGRWWGTWLGALWFPRSISDGDGSANGHTNNCTDDDLTAPMMAPACAERANSHKRAPRRPLLRN